MQMHGIKFRNRTKTIGADAEDPALMDSQFAAFACLCASVGVALYVLNVEYSSNWCGYAIDVDGSLEHSQIGGAIEWAADKTLPQFEIFGRIEHRGGLDEC